MVPGCLGEERIIVTLTTQEVNHGHSERKTQVLFCHIGGVDCFHYYWRIVLLQSVLKSAKSIRTGKLRKLFFRACLKGRITF